MNMTRSLFVIIGLTVCGEAAVAQDLSRYRAYVLESSVDSVVAASGARAADTRTLHERLRRFSSWTGVHRTWRPEAH